jgi:hypothetical protein
MTSFHAILDGFLGMILVMWCSHFAPMASRIESLTHLTASHFSPLLPFFHGTSLLPWRSGEKRHAVKRVKEKQNIVDSRHLTPVMDSAIVTRILFIALIMSEGYLNMIHK